MAARSKVTYWQAIASAGYGYADKRWIVYSGPPDDQTSEVVWDLEDAIYRPLIKGLPLFEDGVVLQGRMSFTPVKERKKRSDNKKKPLPSDK